MSQPFSWALFEAMPVIGIMRNFPPEHLDATVEAYGAAGLSSLEITLNTPGAAGIIRHLRGAYAGRLNIGAGTVLTDDDLELALEAGAQFIVTPVVVKSVIKTCKKRDIPVFPGAMTPTEIYKAWSYGASAVKVFPAGRLGPGYLKDVLEPLNEIKLLPTGGISTENLFDFLKAGASGAGMGSALFPKDLLTAGDTTDLRRFYDAFVKRYHDFKNNA